MRSFTSDYRLQGFSVAEIAGEFEEAVLRLSKTHQFNGRKLKPGPMLNALVVWFLSLSEEERVCFAGEHLARLEAFLAETDAERAAVPLPAPAEPPKRINVPLEIESDGPKLTPPKGARKRRA